MRVSVTGAVAAGAGKQILAQVMLTSGGCLECCFQNQLKL